MDFRKTREYIIENNSQAHLCICNTNIFENTIFNGVYGFPHSGNSKLKSFWRSVASLYNIGPFDIIFFYRTQGTQSGCQEIHGPFKVFIQNNQPCIYYDLASKDFPLFIKEDVDCKVRFLFSDIERTVYSIKDNYEIIKRYESKDLWGYRHPAVMNIGAARKKSITSFTNRQAKILLDVMEKYGEKRLVLHKPIPIKDRASHYINLKSDNNHFKLDDNFLIKYYSLDEAYLYCYFLRAIKYPDSIFRKNLFCDMSKINDNILKPTCIYEDLTKNALLETIISSHLQDELDIVLTNKDDEIMLINELKTDIISSDALKQTEQYINLLEAIFPTKKIFANIIGAYKEDNLIPKGIYANRIKLIKYRIETMSDFQIRFEDITE